MTSRSTEDNPIYTPEANRLFDRVINSAVGTEITVHSDPAFEGDKPTEVKYRVTGTTHNKRLEEVPNSRKNSRKNWGKYDILPSSDEKVSLRSSNQREYDNLRDALYSRLDVGEKVSLKRTALTTTKRNLINAERQAERRQLRLFR